MKKEKVEVVVTVKLEIEAEEVGDFEACFLAEDAATVLRAWEKSVVEEHWRPQELTSKGGE